MRDLWAFLVVCAFIAGVTLGARMVRVEAERGQKYAAVIASCANGADIVIGATIVHCVPVEVR